MEKTPFIERDEELDFDQNNQSEEETYEELKVINVEEDDDSIFAAKAKTLDRKDYQREFDQIAKLKVRIYS